MTAKQSGFVQRIDSNKGMSPSIKRRIRVEETIAKAVIKDLLAAGYAISVDNGGDEFELTCSTDENAILAEMSATDDEHLYVHRMEGDKFNKRQTCGWVYFVYGNDGWDVVNDYTVNLESALVGMHEATKRAEEGL